MIKNLPLILFFISRISPNIISDGDFENYSPGSQLYTNSWFNGQDITFQFYVAVEGSNKVLEIDFFAFIICQNVTFTTESNYSLSFKAKKVALDT